VQTNCRRDLQQWSTDGRAYFLSEAAYLPTL
jgi:hypothetical protein